MLPVSRPTSELYQISVPITYLSAEVVHIETWRSLVSGIALHRGLPANLAVLADRTRLPSLVSAAIPNGARLVGSEDRSLSFDGFLEAGLSASQRGMSVQTTVINRRSRQGEGGF
jgi:hypothetical protein